MRPVQTVTSVLNAKFVAKLLRHQVWCSRSNFALMPNFLFEDRAASFVPNFSFRTLAARGASLPSPTTTVRILLRKTKTSSTNGCVGLRAGDGTAGLAGLGAVAQLVPGSSSTSE